MKFEYFFENVSSKLKFNQNRTRITGTLHEDQYTVWIVSPSVLRRMKTVSDKTCRENYNTNGIQYIYIYIYIYIYLKNIVPLMK